MYATLMHHSRECSESASPQRVTPQPEGVGIALYACPVCGAVASSPRSAHGLA
jgi:hypothetical protein